MGCVQSEAATAVSEVENIFTSRDFHSRYVLHEKLGSGAFAVVYSASPAHGPNRVMAVKVTDLRSGTRRSQGFEQAESDPEQLRQARKEARLLGTLAGSNHVLRVFDSFFSGGLAYTVMERSDRTLVQALERLPELNEKTFRPYIHGMVSGLAFVHSKGIVHRDIKPDNILCFGPRDTVKICDFGLARFLPKALGAEPCIGVCGTAPYMSPEMLQQRPYDDMVDTWSLGVLIYTFCFGCFPYMPKAWSDKGMQEAIVSGTPEPAFKPADAGHPNAVSSSLVAFVRGLLNRNPTFRLSAVSALAHDYFANPWVQVADLRPMLQSARRFGVFDHEKRSENRWTDVDRRLRELQDHHHPRKSLMAVMDSETSTAVGAMKSSKDYSQNCDSRNI